MNTIGKIPIDCFASEPSPEELGALIAHWNSEDQASFFMCFAEHLQNCCGGRMPTQLSWIALSLRELETLLCDGKGSALVVALARFVEEQLASEAEQ